MLDHPVKHQLRLAHCWWPAFLCAPALYLQFPTHSWYVTLEISQLPVANNPPQAHRLITQVLLTGSRIVGRAFAEAYKQAQASQKYAAAAAKNPANARSFASGLTLEEACKILNVGPPQAGKANMEQVMERFKRLFDMNDPKKGGSFYLQSKILRARERIEMEVRGAEEAAAREKELKEGWNPKIYKDR